MEVALKKLELKSKKPKRGSPENLNHAGATGRANFKAKTCAKLTAQFATKTCTNTSVKKTRYIPSQMKRQVWLRDKGMCRYKDPLSQRVCGSRKFVQFDHIKPLAKGGPTEVANLRLLCANHNAFMAKLHFGDGK